MVHVPGPEVRTKLFGRRLIERRPEGATGMVLAYHAAALETLVARFGMRFPAGKELPLLETAEI
jgi:hypothetical protein